MRAYMPHTNDQLAPGLNYAVQTLRTHLDSRRRLEERRVELHAIENDLVRQRPKENLVVHVQTYKQYSCNIADGEVQFPDFNAGSEHTKEEACRGQDCCLSVAHRIIILHGRGRARTSGTGDGSREESSTCISVRGASASERSEPWQARRHQTG